jgi:hypothetical protein
MEAYITTIYNTYASLVIQWDLRSVDHTGAPISGLEPYIENILTIELYLCEMENLEAIAQDLVWDGTH